MKRHASSALLLLSLLAQSLVGQSPVTFRYFYDNLNRLAAALDSTGTIINYKYDAAGNILQVTRSTVTPGGALTLFNITPLTAPTGTTITIQGQGFSTTLSANLVTMNGVALTVLSATSTTLVVQIPVNATTGTISVTVAGVTVTWSSLETILPAPGLTSLSPGSAKANTTASVTVTGLNLLGATFTFQNPVPGLATVPGPITVVSNNGTTAVLSIPTGSAQGQYALVATNSAGSSGSTAAAQFIVLPPGAYTVDSPPVSTLNVAPATLITGTLGSALVSVLNVAPPTLTTGSGTLDSAEVSVLNLKPALGKSSAGSFLVAVCNVASGCTAQVPASISLPAARPLSVTASAPQPPLDPRLEPVESLDSIVQGRSILLTAEWVEPGNGATVQFEVNGAVVGAVTGAPYSILFTVPAGVQDLMFRAIVTLPTGAQASSRLVHVPVVSDGGAPVKLPRLEKGETATLFAGGLKAEYFAFAYPQATMPSLDGLAPKRIGFVTAVNQPNPGAIFGDDPLGAGLTGDFAVRFSGDLWAEGGGDYKFWLTVRNGAELRIDGKTVAAADVTMGSPVEAAGAATLNPGWHKVEVLYLRAVGMESVRLEWQQPGATRQVVSPQYFRTALDGVSADTVPAMFDSVWVRLQQESGTREIMLRPRQ